MRFTGKDVLNAFKSDIESFFYPSANFVMNVAVKGTKTRYMGNADSAGIMVSEDFADCEVDSLEAMIFLLIVLGHEAAHYLNVHGGYRDESNADTKALEAWADFFGTKAAIVAMTIGERTHELAASLPGGDKTGARVDAIGAAIGRLATTFFETDDERYEPAPVRVSTCVAGVMSALDTFWLQNGIDKSVQRSLDLQLRLYQAPGMREQISKAAVLAPDQSQMSKIRLIHQAIQASEISITDGMKPEPAAWLLTNYEGSEDERLAQVEKGLELLKGEIKKKGFEDDPDK